VEALHAVELLSWLQETMKASPSGDELMAGVCHELATRLDADVFMTRDTELITLLSDGWRGVGVRRGVFGDVHITTSRLLLPLPSHPKLLGANFVFTHNESKRAKEHVLFCPLTVAEDVVAWMLVPGRKVYPASISGTTWRVIFGQIALALRERDYSTSSKTSSPGERDEHHQARYEQIQRLAGVGSWEFTPGSSRMWWSQSFYDMLGYDPDEVDSNLENMRARVHPQDRHLFELDSGFGSKPRVFEWRAELPDGTMRMFQSREFVEYRGQDGVRAYCLVRDCSQEDQASKERQQELERKLRNAQKMESLGLLAGGVAHDFNNILMGIVGFAELGIQETPEGAPTRQHLRSILDNARRAASRCEQLLSFAGRREMTTKRMDLSRIVRETSELVAVTFGDRVRVRNELSEGLPSVMIDSSQIREVVLNLLTNAADALGETGGTIMLRSGEKCIDEDTFLDQFVSRVLPSGCYVYAEVIDNGCGIPPENLQRLFDPFFTTKPDGHGLGMAAAIGNIHNHNGAIAIRSQVGKGTIVGIYLPCQPSREYMKSAPYLMMEEAALTKVGGKILFADDEQMIRTLAKTFLTQAGYEVALASDGIEVLSLMDTRGGDFDVIVMDMIMPKLDGADTLKLMRKRWPDIPVVVSSGYSRKLSERMLNEHKIHAFMQKPYEPTALLKVLEDICAAESASLTENS